MNPIPISIIKQIPAINFTTGEPIPATATPADRIKTTMRDTSGSFAWRVQDKVEGELTPVVNGLSIALEMQIEIRDEDPVFEPLSE